MESVGSYQAKTHLPRLLERVANGEKIMITRHGVPIAILAPAAAGVSDVAKTIKEIKHFRKGRSLGGISIRQMIEEGRTK